MAKYGLIVFHNSINLGDDIQSYADEIHLPHTDYIIDREKLDEFYLENGEKVACIMGGWYLHNHLNWPPSPFIKPLAISMHFDTYFSKTLGAKLTENLIVEDYGAEWLLQNAPVGCRDHTSKELLDKFNIPAYMSGCITLTIKPFQNVERHGNICLVDTPIEVTEFVEKHTNKKIVKMTHTVPLRQSDWLVRRGVVEDRLKYYQGASLVVTKRLHAALPCLALGIPVLMIKEDWALNRTGTWLPYLNHVSVETLLSGEYIFDFDNPKGNPQDYQKVAESLKYHCKKFITHCETQLEEEFLDVLMFQDGRKRTERLKRLIKIHIEDQ